MNDNETRSTRLRQRLDRGETIVLGGAYDGLSAYLAEEAGFDGIWASGFCVSTSKRIADVGLVTMSEHLDRSREMHRATTSPVVADVDDGFGDFVNVTRMVKEYEAAGIAAVCLEDSRHPKRCSFYSELERDIVPAAEFADKIRAAKDAQETDEFVVIARTEALVVGCEMEEALERGERYVEAGADLLFVHNTTRSSDPIEEFGTRWTKPTPLVAVPTTYPQATVKKLGEWGFQVVIFANQGLRASITALSRIYGEMMARGRLDGLKTELADLSEVARIVDLDHVLDLEARFGKKGPDLPEEAS